MEAHSLLVGMALFQLSYKVIHKEKFHVFWNYGHHSHGESSYRPL